MIIETSISALIPTQASISWKNLERIAMNFDASKYKPPAVVRYDGNAFLILDGHHRLYTDYLRGLENLDVNLIESPVLFQEESRGRVIKFASIETFVEYYNSCLKEIFQRIDLMSVPDFKRFIY